MKKILIVFLTMILTFSLTACGTKNNETENPNGSENNDVKNNIDYKTWGVTDALVAENGMEGATFYLNYPKYVGVTKASGWVAAQDEPVLVVVDRECDTGSPEVSSIEDVLPAYFEQTAKVLTNFYGSRSSNFNFSIKNKTKTKINNYEMSRVVGQVTFDYKKENIQRQFVAYATQLKANGAYVYWLLIDGSEDQSMMNLAEEWAYNMAQTFREEK